MNFTPSIPPMFHDNIFFIPNKISRNIFLAFEIACQMLMSINCCSKIFIYLLCYDEYWTSLKSLKNCFQCSTAPGEVNEKFPIRELSWIGFWHIEGNCDAAQLCTIKHSFLFTFYIYASFLLTQQIINTSKHLFPSTKADVESLLNYSLNKKRYATQIPPEERHYGHAASAQRPRRLSLQPRLSLTPSAADGMEMNRFLTFPQVERQPSTRSNKSFRALRLCPSQASLTRSVSLNIQSTMKHSPNCRLNKKVLN